VIVVLSVWIDQCGAGAMLYHRTGCVVSWLGRSGDDWMVGCMSGVLRDMVSASGK